MFSGTSGVILQRKNVRQRRTNGYVVCGGSLPLRGGRDEFRGWSGHIIIVKAARNEGCTQLGSTARRSRSHGEGLIDGGRAGKKEEEEESNARKGEGS
jgi:hypothetical protein